MVFGVWCLVFGVWCLVFGVWCLLFVVCCLLFVVCCLLFVVCCLLLVDCCLLFVVTLPGNALSDPIWVTFGQLLQPFWFLDYCWISALLLPYCCPTCPYCYLLLPIVTYCCLLLPYCYLICLASCLLLELGHGTRSLALVPHSDLLGLCRAKAQHLRQRSAK